MAKQGVRKWWSRFVAALGLAWRVLGLAGRIPLDLWLRHARYWFQLWPELITASAVAAEKLQPYQAVYRHRVVSAVRLRLEEIRLQSRIQLAVLVPGLAITGWGWIWLSFTANARGAWYAAASAAFFLLNAVATAPAAAFTAHPWRRLGGLAVFWAALSIGLLAADGRPKLDGWYRQPPDPLLILVFATGSVAVFCLMGALLARIGYFTGDFLVDRRRTRKYPETGALLQTLTIVATLGKNDDLGGLFDRRALMLQLTELADYLGVHLPRFLTVRGHGLPEAARDRFVQAAGALRGYQAQVAIPGPDTHPALRAHLAELTVPLLTGHYDLLPVGEAAARPPRWPTHLVSGLLAAALPLVVVIVYPMLGFALPDYLRQWLTGFAVVWLIARILHLLDPAYGNTWDRVHSVLSPRSLAEKPYAETWT